MDKNNNCITGVIKRPGERAYIDVSIDNDLDYLQEIVGGWIETVTPGKDWTIICNEEGRINGMPYNCCFLGLDFYGPIIVVGVDGEEFTSLLTSFAGRVKSELNRRER